MVFAGSGELTFEQHQNLNDQNNQEADRNWFSLSVTTARPKKKIDTYLNVDLRYYHTNSDYMYSLSEGFVRYQDRKGEVTLGRKIVNWQRAEKFWNTGDLNSSRGFSLIEGNKEGLFGLHIDRKMGDFNLSLLGSYFYVPQLNPGYEYGDGRVTSRSTWVKVPPKSVKYRGELIPIYYDVERPANSEVLLQESFGGRLAYEWERGEIYSYGVYKPENHLRFNATATYEQTDTEQVLVKVRPFVNHHLIYGTGATQKIGDLALSTEVEMVRPDKENKGDFFQFEEIRFSPTYIDKSMWRTSAVINKNFLRVGGHYFQLLSHEGKSDDFFTEKSAWKRAAGFSLGYDFNDRIGADLLYKYDLVRADTIWQSDFNYRISKEMMGSLGVALLVSPRKESYWSPYKSNDSIFSSLSYLF